MRLRHIPGAEQEIENSPLVVQDAREHRGNWRELFGNDHPLHLEVGMGKGRFLMDMARLRPEINYLGIERYSSVLLKAVQKLESLGLPNIRFLCVDARELPEIFAPGEVQKIYLNFSDPWPKDRHAKRRLTSPQFMGVYEQILEKNGEVEFKTDNRELFAYSLEAIPQAGWEITEHTFDLHHSPMGEGNVMTEYEEKFSSRGQNICKLKAVRKLPVPAAKGLSQV